MQAQLAQLARDQHGQRRRNGDRHRGWLRNRRRTQSDGGMRIARGNKGRQRDGRW